MQDQGPRIKDFEYRLELSPRLDAASARAIAREYFGVDADATPLPGERDQNVRLDVRARPGVASGTFVLKIAHPSEHRALLEAQNAAMSLVAPSGLAPRVVPTVGGDTIVEHVTPDGTYLVRLLTWITGRPLGTVRRHPDRLLEDLGRCLGAVDHALAAFDHPAIRRDFQWDLAGGIGVVQAHAAAIRDADMRTTVEHTVSDVAAQVGPLLERLPRSAIHNDANDYNVIVAGDPASGLSVAGLIDFGDLVHSCTVADLAVAAAYVALDKSDPLHAVAAVVRGYAAVRPLTDDDLGALFGLIQLRLCLSVALAAHQQAQRPGDEYLQISQRAIERTLPLLRAIPARFAEATFRHAAGREPVPASARVAVWLRSVPAFAPVMPIAAGGRVATIDLSVESLLVSVDPADNSEPAMTSRINDALERAGAVAGVGRYLEPRLLYVAPQFASGSGVGERRMIHLGVDLFAPAGTVVHAPLAGVVVAAGDNVAHLDYGPVIILEHATDAGDVFYTLYGHLSRASLVAARPGRVIAAGEAFAALGDATVNGGWTPHLHLQLVIDLMGKGVEMPGVCRASEREVWRALSPDPTLMMRLDDAAYPDDGTSARLAARRQRIGPSLSVAYHEPVTIVRGWKQYLFDESGRQYLDGYNNVPHVGHAHPRVADAAAAQLRRANTNTRYLHDGLARYAERLTATLPDPLRVCYFVNSGSEANELALRLARAHTGRRDMIVLDAAYHGNTTTLIDISPYKFNGPGGQGAPPWVHVVEVPDVYRGRYRSADPRVAAQYAGDVAETIAAIEAGRPGSRLCGFIAETCPSVAGQILLPPGYLPEVYAHVRKGGGVCIADEVQTAYGRMGTHFHAFEAHGVVPDIVVLGKPIGNGYPLGAVVTTAAIAASFDTGMEFFSTFGGSTVSCAVGEAVLEVTEDEGLQAHGLRVGQRLLNGLREVGRGHGLVGDVRGSGLFIGVELVRDRDTLEPASREASWVVNRMREEGILLGTDGPLHNVIKIRPPMPFDGADADRLVETIDAVLSELPGRD